MKFLSHFKQYLVLNLCIVMTMASVNIQEIGWLDRVVQHYKKSFYDDFKRLASVKINATIEKAPPGYKDSPHWTFETVSNLLALISQSESSKPVFRALRRMLAPSRRIIMSKFDSYKHFPSLSKYIVNDIYYDTDSEEFKLQTKKKTFVTESMYSPEVLPEEEAIIVVSNPVEAKLPSAQISVNLLKEILEARAMAGRIMPSTTKRTFFWVTTATNITSVENVPTVVGNESKVTEATTTQELPAS